MPEKRKTEVPGDLGIPVVDIIDEIKTQLTPELQAMVNAGTPVVIMVKPISEGLKVEDTKTFTSFGKPEASLEEVKKDRDSLIEVIKFMEERVKEADWQFHKVFRDKKKTDKRLDKAKIKIRDMKKDIDDLHKKYKD